jgi:hypothetical protein
MLDWLFEGHRHLAVYVILAAAGVLFVVVAVRTRKRRWLAGAGAAATLAGLYLLLDVAAETDSEQIERKVDAMAAGFRAPANLDAVFDNVSDHFHSSYAADKQALREMARQNIQSSGITDVRILEFHSGEISREKNTATAEFRAKVVGNFGGGLQAVTVHCGAMFDYDAAHGWRLRGLGVKAEYPIQNVDFPP